MSKYSILNFVFLLLFPSLVFADRPGKIEIFPTPIFNNIDNFSPGSSVSSRVRIVNNSGRDYSAITLGAQVSNSSPDSLGPALELKVGNLPPAELEFLLHGGLLPLSGGIKAGQARTFDFTMVFKDQSRNNFEDKSVVFDFVFRFAPVQNRSAAGPAVVIVSAGGGKAENPPNPSGKPSEKPAPLEFQQPNFPKKLSQKNFYGINKKIGKKTGASLTGKKMPKNATAPSSRKSPAGKRAAKVGNFLGASAGKIMGEEFFVRACAGAFLLLLVLLIGILVKKRE